MPAQPHDTPAMRLDKWLWAARFYKTRSLAVDEIQKGRVEVNGHHAKPSRDVRVGDTVVLRQQGGLARTVQVLGLSAQRGPAPVARPARWPVWCMPTGKCALSTVAMHASGACARRPMVWWKWM